ncbi:MAG TPA: outer membrane lipoprotein-sorting protein [Opitutaceae bacterium]|nr:outer membrane lipoprotein-sorting protein [Opitutaceae bacterium]
MNRFLAPRIAAALVLASTFFAGDIAAQSRFRPSPNYAEAGEPDKAEGARMLAEFRSLGIAGDYALDFDLRVMPRRGHERTVSGRMFGAREGGSDVTLVRFNADIQPRALLFRKGPDGGVWSHDGSAPEAHKLDEAEMFEPIAGTNLTAFDLTMPFLAWSDIVYEGVTNLRGRPAQRFIAYPPEAVAAAHPELSGVRFHLDAQFNALVQAELIGPGGEPVKTITVLELKRTRDQWVVKTIDVRNDSTRDKTRFRVTAAALGISHPRAIFQPAHLPIAPIEIPTEQFEKFR